ncbi:MAG: galactokinase [Chloroflexi bacterium]|nr:galactokinase [Chloroflexota bacterium]
MDYAALISRFERQFGHRPAFLSRAPGRVNLIGEHTDYNDGFVLPMAIDREVAVVGAPRDDRRIRLYALNFDDEADFALDQLQRSEPADWSDYPRGVAWALQEAGFDLAGFDGVLYGDVPIGSGLSSSAAIEMAVFMAFAACQPALAGLDRVRAAKLAQRAENAFVGVNCGIMDQFVSALGQAGHALFIDCRSLDYAPVPMPGGTAVVVVDTAAPRSLAASAYNERRAQCEAAARLLGVPALRDLSPEIFAQRRAALPALVAQRAEHVIYENRRVLDAVAALRAGDVATFGRLMNESHDSLRDLYEVSSAELDAVVEIARGVSGVYGARMTGAGFGGCAIALAEQTAVDALRDAVMREYPARTGRQPSIYVCTANDGASWRLLT